MTAGAAAGLAAAALALAAVALVRSIRLEVGLANQDLLFAGHLVNHQYQ